MSPSVPEWDAQGQEPGEDGLFPHERKVLRPSRRDPRIGIKQWLFQAIPDFKSLGNRILTAERIENAEKRRVTLKAEDAAGDPIEDGKALGKILRGTDHRRFDLDWLDHAEAEYGRDWMVGFLTFLNNRYGCQDAKRVPDPQLDAERQKRIAEKAEQGIAILGEVLAELRARKEGA